ncbi:hypothetical protein FD755_014564 [Muntiacus reevesi]|uniref:Carbohydrate kinase FGGY N-terminal domain-containing protein n=1 Tax=Muntiacus reevesi TaxID=9886 RepID=A0A5N3XMM5_MUNRE|nr:hypothetical protein FD755_014564 [Muntiacus reevesi]
MSEQPTIPEQSAPDSRRAGFVLGMDVGSSVIRCHVYDRAARICGSSAQKVESLYPQAGWVEIDPDALWLQFVAVIKESVKGNWIYKSRDGNVKTGKHFHNFISWQDLRAIELVKSWNNSLLMKLIHSSCRVLHFFTRSKQFLAASLFTFTTQHVSLRLAWILQNLTEVRKDFVKVNELKCTYHSNTVALCVTFSFHFCNLHVYSSALHLAFFAGIFSNFAFTSGVQIQSLISMPLPKKENAKTLKTNKNFTKDKEEHFIIIRYTFFLRVYGSFSRIDYILHHNTVSVQKLYKVFL